MLRGDIDNSVAPIVALRFENTLYNFGKLNKAAKGFLEHLVGAQSLNVYLISSLPARKVAAFCYKWGVPYSKIIEAETTLEIPEICIANKIVVYYDTDDQILENVRARGNPQTRGERWTLVDI